MNKEQDAYTIEEKLKSIINSSYLRVFESTLNLVNISLKKKIAGDSIEIFLDKELLINNNKIRLGQKVTFLHSLPENEWHNAVEKSFEELLKREQVELNKSNT